MADQTFELYTGSATGTQIDNAAAKVAAMEETLSGTAATIPSSAAVKNYVDSKSVDTESTLSGNASKIPSSKAVKDVTDTLLPKSDATFLTSKTRAYYTVFNEENTTIIEGYKYTAGDDVLTASENDKCYLVENINFDSLVVCGLQVYIAVIDDLNGTTLVNRVYSARKDSPYHFLAGGQMTNYQGKKLLISFYGFNKPALRLYSYPGVNLIGGAFGVNSVSESALLLKALENNGKAAAIIAAQNTDGVIGDGMTNALVASDEQQLVGSDYIGKLSLSPSTSYSKYKFLINYCPNITHLNVNVADNNKIKEVRIALNPSLSVLRLKLNSTQSIALTGNQNLQTLILEGTYNLGQNLAFSYCMMLKRIDISNAVAISYLQSMFMNCTSLEWVDMSNVPITLPSELFISANNFLGCSALSTLIGNHTLAEVEAGTITCFTGLKFSLKLSYCSLLSRASLLATIKGLYDFSQDANFDSETAYATLTLGETLSEKLEENDIDILIAKGWEIL